MQHYVVTTIVNQAVTFASEDYHHIQNVMRFRSGDHVIAIHHSKRYEVELTIAGKSVLGKVVKELPSQQNKREITLIYGLPKAEKWELVLQKATELGVSRIIPFQSAKSLVDIAPGNESTKIERWQRIVKEAVEQSEQSLMPVIEPIRRTLKFADITASQKLFAYERSISSKTFLEWLTPLSDSIVIVVGPEAGWSKEEADYFAALGYHWVTLGTTILRSETAALYMLAGIKLLGEQK